ncbi:MAG: SDR family NAD(P)-dependent oxidoreductase [Cyanobacteria bacterium P01_G01_bin.39]
MSIQDYRAVVVGASRGIGAAVAHHIEPRTRKLLTVSRTPSSCGQWIQADISAKSGIERVQSAVADSHLDALLYMGGIWEKQAFTPQYSFEKCSDQDLENVIAVNLIAPIRLVKALLPALRQAPNPKIILQKHSVRHTLN